MVAAAGAASPCSIPTPVAAVTPQGNPQGGQSMNNWISASRTPPRRQRPASMRRAIPCRRRSLRPTRHPHPPQAPPRPPRPTRPLPSLPPLSPPRRLPRGIMAGYSSRTSARCSIVTQVGGSCQPPRPCCQRATRRREPDRRWHASRRQHDRECGHVARLRRWRSCFGR